MSQRLVSDSDPEPAFTDSLSAIYYLTDEQRQRRLALAQLCLLFQDEPKSALYSSLCEVYSLIMSELGLGLYRYNSSFNK